MTDATTDRLFVRLDDGRRVGYARYGDPAGLPVLALHGAPACRLMFAPADMEARKRGLCLYAPDRPGYGITSPDSAATLQTRTDWLRRFVTALGLDRFSVFAISGGGPYAVALAAAMPERVRALALVSPMGPVADYVASPLATKAPLDLLHRRFFLYLPHRTWLTEPVASLVSWSVPYAPEMVTRGLAIAAGEPDARVLARPEIREMLQSMTLEAFRQGGHGGAADLFIYSEPWQVDYTAIRAPSVLWQGTADRIVPPDVTFALGAWLPRCRVHRLEGAGHFWVLDHVETVLSELAALMANSPVA